MSFREVDLKSLEFSPFAKIGDEWALLTAGTTSGYNTMTVSWGGMGVLWGKDVVTVYVRPQRYTKEFVDREEYFTLAFFGEEQRKALTLCGSKSGREVDKVKECGFTVAQAECGAPYFEEAELVLVCRKRYAQEMDPQAIPQDAKDRFYPEKDYHTMYIGEVVEALRK